MLDQFLGRPAMTELGRRATRTRLRVLAMHGVEDVERFDHQLDELLRWFTPVGSGQVAATLAGGPPLPKNAVWFTFDDGDRSTIVDAAPVLQRHGVRATAFVCPGLVESGEPPWWTVVASAVRRGHPVTIDGRRYDDQRAVTALKQVPDRDRRELVAALPADPEGSDDEPVTLDDLTRWRDLGGDVGNHTWDHPCLNHCSPAEQADQIDRAADWLDRHGLWDRRLFAYPNGDRTDAAERHLVHRGYEIVALFDHHLAAHRPRPEAVSRLRLDAGAPADRTRAVASGWNSGLFTLRDRARRLVRQG